MKTDSYYQRRNIARGLKFMGVFTSSSKCIQNTRANAGRLLDRINGWVAFRLIAFRLISFRVVYIYTN